MSNRDWAVFYEEERRRPAYVIEDGKSILKTKEGLHCRDVKRLQRERRKAA